MFRRFIVSVVHVCATLQGLAAYNTLKTDQFCKGRSFHLVRKVSSTSNVFAKHKATSLGDCCFRCLDVKLCVGFGYNERVSSTQKENCELTDVLDHNGNSLNNHSDSSYYQQSHLPKSCAEIFKQFGYNRNLKNGKYWIFLDTTEPLKVYCDMETDGGGWTLVSNIVLNTSEPSVVKLKDNWQAIHRYAKGKLALSAGALGDLMKKIPFIQLRFHCFKKIPGRTFHVVTKENELGDNVVKFFTAQIDELPKSCHSFYHLPDDNSRLSQFCHRWKDEYWSLQGQKSRVRLVSHIAFIPGKHHWVSIQSRWECDDYNGTFSTGDFWKIFVR